MTDTRPQRAMRCHNHHYCGNEIAPGEPVYLGTLVRPYQPGEGYGAPVPDAAYLGLRHSGLCHSGLRLCRECFETLTPPLRRDDLESFACEVCSRVILKPLGERNGNTRICSRSCRDRKEYLWRKQIRSRLDSRCQHCGQAFKARSDAKYCGTRCRVAAKRKRDRQQ